MCLHSFQGDNEMPIMVCHRSPRRINHVSFENLTLSTFCRIQYDCTHI